jgi:hypothetical protein
LNKHIASDFENCYINKKFLKRVWMARAIQRMFDGRAAIWVLKTQRRSFVFSEGVYVQGLANILVAVLLVGFVSLFI